MDKDTLRKYALSNKSFRGIIFSYKESPHFVRAVIINFYTRRFGDRLETYYIKMNGMPV